MSPLAFVYFIFFLLCPGIQISTVETSLLDSSWWWTQVYSIICLQYFIVNFDLTFELPMMRKGKETALPSKQCLSSPIEVG